MFVAILLLTVSVQCILNTPMAVTKTEVFENEQTCTEFINSVSGREWMNFMVHELEHRDTKVLHVDRIFCTEAQENKI